MKKQRGIAAFFIVTLLFVTPALSAHTTWYVDDNAPGDPGPGDPSVSDPLEDGTLSHPYDAIQEGIDASTGGDTVMVKDGTYTGTGNRDIDFNGKAIIVRSENGADCCIIDCEGTELDEHRGFYFHSGEALNSILGGFTIKHGYIWAGGGIYCDTASPTIMKNIITQNECPSSSGSGGGIYCVNGSPKIMSNTITYNIVGGDFGYGGGGICCWGGSSTIKKNTISNNFNYLKGGGISCSGDQTISDNIIFSNGVYGSGAGIFCFGTATMTHNIISGNWAGGEGLGYGGGIAAESYYGTITIGYNIITGNNAHYQGGGISCHSFSNGTVMIANNVITENESRDLHSGDGGGGIYCVDGPVTISNNTISGNDVTGGGHGHGGGIYCYDANVTVINSILWNNTADEIYFYSGSVTVSYSDVQGGYPGTGNIDKDPLFVTGPSGGYYLSQFTAGQSANSPCVDSGNPLSDMIFGTTRTDMKPDILINDMGYHYPITSSSLDMSIKLPPGSLLEGPPGYDKRIGPN